MRKPSVPPHDIVTITPSAIHEAGHALAYLKHRRVIAEARVLPGEWHEDKHPELSATLRAEGIGGRVTPLWRRYDNSKRIEQAAEAFPFGRHIKDSLGADIDIYLAGWAAELAYFAEPRIHWFSPSQPDFQHAYERAANYVDRVGFKARDAVILRELNASLKRMIRYFNRPTTQYVLADLANELLRHQRLTGKQIKAVVGAARAALMDYQQTGLLAY